MKKSLNESKKSDTDSKSLPILTIDSASLKTSTELNFKTIGMKKNIPRQQILKAVKVDKPKLIPKSRIVDNVTSSNDSSKSLETENMEILGSILQEFDEGYKQLLEFFSKYESMHWYSSWLSSSILDFSIIREVSTSSNISKENIYFQFSPSSTSNIYFIEGGEVTSILQRFSQQNSIAFALRVRFEVLLTQICKKEDKLLKNISIPPTTLIKGTSISNQLGQYQFPQVLLIYEGKSNSQSLESFFFLRHTLHNLGIRTSNILDEVFHFHAKKSEKSVLDFHANTDHFANTELHPDFSRLVSFCRIRGIPIAVSFESDEFHVYNITNTILKEQSNIENNEEFVKKSKKLPKFLVFSTIDQVTEYVSQILKPQKSQKSNPNSLNKDSTTPTSVSTASNAITSSRIIHWHQIEYKATNHVAKQKKNKIIEQKIMLHFKKNYTNGKYTIDIFPKKVSEWGEYKVIALDLSFDQIRDMNTNLMKVTKFLNNSSRKSEVKSFLDNHSNRKLIKTFLQELSQFDWSGTLNDLINIFIFSIVDESMDIFSFYPATLEICKSLITA